MRKERILLTLGVWVAILPYLGFPSSWKDILYTLTGLGMIYLAYMLYRQFKSGTQGEIRERSFENFRENKNFNNTVIEHTTEETLEKKDPSFNKQEEI